MQHFQDQSATVPSGHTAFSDKASAAHSVMQRVLMIGPHRTRTLGGISTMIDGLLRAAPTAGCEMRHIASQCDEVKGLSKLPLAARALLQYVLTVIVWRPNVTLVHVGSNASLYRKAVFIVVGRWLGQKMIAHFHAGDFDHYYEKQRPQGQRLILSGLRRSHKLIAVSQASANRLRQLLPNADIVMIPNGIKTQEFAPVVRKRDGFVRLLFVGGMGKLKGERDLLRAFQIAVARVPQLRISLLGHGAETITTFCDEAGLRPYIEHLGPVPHRHRAEFFRQADLFVLPSYGEGMPMSVLEAMAAGLPVISTKVGGIPELITSGQEGYLLAPGDVQAFAEQIVRLATDAELRTQMGQRARDKAQLFDESRVMTALLKELHAFENKTRKGEG